MYCPQCSQQQVSDDVRFCSRCGFSLGPVAQLLAGGEVIRRETETHRKLSLRHLQGTHKGTRIGAKMLFFSMVLVPLAIALSAAVDSPGPLLIPFILFLAGLTQVLYVRIFSENALPEKRPQPAIPGANERRFESPLPQPAPAQMIDSRPTNTSEIVQPPSVTERTTTLLEKK
ncbi:MAG TPA: zinc ribbon domain-containing protein [Pyrinomonadaceae bacterium]|jgi:hypothetical protein|nr:zinc ribbon domain-containing protein [Pyrinomonadaceae bacterium]